MSIHKGVLRGTEGSVIVEFAVILPIFVLILSALVNFCSHLSEDAILAESLRVAGRKAALLEDLVFKPSTYGPSPYQNGVFYTNGTAHGWDDTRLTAILRPEAKDSLERHGLDRSKYRVRIQVFRVRYDTGTLHAQCQDAAYAQIEVEAKESTSGLFGNFLLAPAARKTLVRINLANPEELNPALARCA